jgi:hypothetical protein
MVRGDQLDAITRGLCHDLKFRADPFEWVYEGYAPLLLPNVLSTRYVNVLSHALTAGSRHLLLGACSMGAMSPRACTCFFMMYRGWCLFDAAGKLCG